MKTASRLKTFRPHLWPVLLLVVATCAVYGRILGHDFLFNWDDNLYVVDNVAIQGFSWSHLKEIFTSCYAGNYAPVPMLSYMLDYSLWGLTAGGFLGTNILLHTVNGLLFYRLLIRWHGDRLFALVAAAVFLLHPLQVESVAWVSQRKNLLAMLFMLLSWDYYWRYRSVGEGKGRGVYTASLGVFIVAVLAKSVAVIFPVVLILYDRCFPHGGRRLRLKDKLPFLLAAALAAAAALYSQSAELGGGRAGFHGGSPLATFFTMVPVVGRYLGLLVWPAGLSAVYAPAIRTTVDVVEVATALALAGIAFGGWLLFRYDRRLGFWLLFIFVGLLPVAQIVPLVTLMNDRYLYFPLLGAAALAGAAACAVRGRLGALRPALLASMVALPLVLLSLMAFQRAGVWRDPLTLWSDAVAKSPTASHAWSSLAQVYFRDVRVQESLQAYEQSLVLDPGNRIAIAALGPIYTEMGELDKGRVLLEKSLKLWPDDVKSWAYLGINQRKRGEYAEAEKMYARALAIKPGSRNVLILAGNLALEQKRFEQALGSFLQAEARWPNDPEIAFRLSCTAALSGQPGEALAWLEKALQRGYREYGNLYDNEELSALWPDPRFTMLVRYYFPDGEQAR